MGAERDEPHRQTEADVDDQVDRAADPGVPAAAQEPRRAELQTEEEEQEDDPELRDEVRHLGGSDQAQ